MRHWLFFFFVLLNANSFAQFSYTPLQECGGDKDKHFYAIDRKDTLCISLAMENGVSTLAVGDLIYRAENRDRRLDYVLCANQKEKRAILLVNQSEQVSLGCDMFLIEKGKATHCGFVPVAAYTKSANGRMDYNSILPYVFLVRISNRYVLSFETPLVVLYPFGEQEEILEGRNLFYTYQNGTLQLNR